MELIAIRIITFLFVKHSKHKQGVAISLEIDVANLFEFLNLCDFNYIYEFIIHNH